MLFIQRFLAVLAVLLLTTPIASAEEFNWAGAYAGITAGQRNTDADWTTTSYQAPNGAPIPFVTDPDASLDNNSTHVNGFLGYNWKYSPKVLLGVEVNVGTANNDKKHTTIPGVSDEAPDFSYIQTEAGLDASVRARVGYLVTPKVNVYGTAGIAMQKVKTKVVCPADTDFCNPAEGTIQNSDSDTLHGWVAGIGLEAAWTKNLMVRAEYSYADYGDYNFDGLPAIGGESYGFASEIDNTSQTFSIGLGYSF